MTPVVVRPAQPSDVERLAQLCALHAAYEHGTVCGPDLSVRLHNSLFSNAPRAKAWVAEAKSYSGAIGYATASPVFSTWQAQDFLHLDCLYLVKSMRGLGIGKRLVEAARVYANAAGLRWLEWQTPTWNALAIDFYGKLGATATPKLRSNLPSVNPLNFTARDF